ncbi:TetR/AcrR family transcriptional regulator [Cellulomonas sp. C5510]|nr:TetR/AcrR family transcriptional regulator [Cellulomonas sp. C5510]
MSGERRREQILAAAMTVFAEGGYAGTTTDQVARAAGVSQPYVVRLFGSKQRLFLELYRSATGRVLEAMAAVAPGPDAVERTGRASMELMADRDLLRVLMHGFTSDDAEVGQLARHTLGEVFRLFRARVGADVPDADETARRFVADGMLFNVLLSSDGFAHAGEDAGLDALLRCFAPEVVAAAAGEVPAAGAAAGERA